MSTKNLNFQVIDPKDDFAARCEKGAKKGSSSFRKYGTSKHFFRQNVKKQSRPKEELKYMY